MIVIVIPAYNEGQVIAHTLQPLLTAGYQVVVVDDGSRDETWDILESLPLCAVRHPINLGQGAALQTGMLAALRLGADVIIHFDADGQHRVEDIPTLSAPIQAGEADVVFGSRFLRPQDIAAIPAGKRLLLRGAVIVNGLLTGLWLTDAHNGFRALSRQAAEKIYLRENGFAHASEILIQVRGLKLRYVEKPTAIIYSEYSKAKGQSPWNAFNILVDLLLGRLFK